MQQGDHPKPVLDRRELELIISGLTGFSWSALPIFRFDQFANAYTPLSLRRLGLTGLAR